MEEEILSKLKEIEKKNKIRIVWAIESGSRAWGFESKDSDYDVRCMHMGEKEDYLGLFPVPLQINFNDGKLDIESWDIKKFSELTLKSNPQIAEWLRSPLVYLDSKIKQGYKELFDKGCSLEYLREHYLSMAKQNYLKYMGIGLAHSCKKYLYVLRAIACAEFIKKEKKLPPLPYKEVIGYLPEEIGKFFEKCVIQKNETENAKISPKKEVTEFIESFIPNVKTRKEINFLKTKELNDYLIKTIKEN